NGQSCIAAKRFLVHTDVYDQFAEAFVAKMSALVVGDPMAEGTDVGPLATESGRDEVEEQVRDAVSHGARVLCGGQRPDLPGWYYPPTVVADLTPQMRIWSEEVFGPVASLYRVSSYEEAVRMANDTSFGLGANAWTQDPAEQERFINDLEAGGVFINGMVTSYPSLPFGGIKNSGYGRELSAHGTREFCNLKTVWVGSQPAGARTRAGLARRRAERDRRGETGPVSRPRPRHGGGRHRGGEPSCGRPLGAGAAADRTRAALPRPPPRRTGPPRAGPPRAGPPRAGPPRAGPFRVGLIRGGAGRAGGVHIAASRGAQLVTLHTAHRRLHRGREHPPLPQHPRQAAQRLRQRRQRRQVPGYDAQQRDGAAQRRRGRPAQPGGPQGVADAQLPAPARVPLRGRCVPYHHLLGEAQPPAAGGQVQREQLLLPAQPQPRREPARLDERAYPQHRRAGQHAHQRGTGQPGRGRYRRVPELRGDRVLAAVRLHQDPAGHRRQPRAGVQHRRGPAERARLPPGVV